MQQLGIVRFYPNPSNGLINFELDLDTSREIELRVRDMLGREVYKNNYFKQKLGEQILLPTGSYLTSLIVDQNITTGVSYLFLRIDWQSINTVHPTFFGNMKMMELQG